MARNKYKNNDLMKFLTILGGLVGFGLLLAHLIGYDYRGWAPALGIDAVVGSIIGMVICAITIWCGVKPDDPIPWHWFVLFILAVLMFVFSAFWGALLVIIAALIGLIDDL
jgi:hypothetical protein